MSIFTQHQTYKDLVHSLWKQGWIEVILSGSDFLLIVHSQAHQQCLSWLLERADTDDDSRRDFIVDDLFHEIKDSFQMNAVFRKLRALADPEYQQSAEEDLRAALHAWNYDFIRNNYMGVLMDWSGMSDLRSAMANREVRDMHNAADDAGVLMHGRAA